MWYQPQVWAQSFNNAVVQANEIKKSKTSSYEWFQVVFFAIHMLIGLMGIVMFIYGVGFKAASTLSINLEPNTDPTITFVVPAALSIISIIFSLSMTFNFTLDYRKILLGIYMVLMIASIVATFVLWGKDMKLHLTDTESNQQVNQFFSKCKCYCKPQASNC